jgi:simple sugar transport system ATP-binding protein
MIVSTELDEVSALADRIAVMYRGKVVGIVGPDTSREVLGLMMAGVPTDEAMAAATTTSAAEEEAAELEAARERVEAEGSHAGEEAR